MLTQGNSDLGKADAQTESDAFQWRGWTRDALDGLRKASASPWIWSTQSSRLPTMEGAQDGRAWRPRRSIRLYRSGASWQPDQHQSIQQERHGLRTGGQFIITGGDRQEIIAEPTGRRSGNLIYGGTAGLGGAFGPMNSVAGSPALPEPIRLGARDAAWRASSGLYAGFIPVEPMACQCSDQPQPCASRRRLEAIRRSDKRPHKHCTECRAK